MPEKINYGDTFTEFIFNNKKYKVEIKKVNPIKEKSKNGK
jgi:hypothetical protein